MKITFIQNYESCSVMDGYSFLFIYLNNVFFTNLNLYFILILIFSEYVVIVAFLTSQLFYSGTHGNSSMLIMDYGIDGGNTRRKISNFSFTLVKRLKNEQMQTNEYRTVLIPICFYSQFFFFFMFLFF